MNQPLPPLHDPLVIRLRGSQAEMGRQFGELNARAGGHHAAVRLYVGPPTMAARILAAGFPYRTRAATERVADVVLGAQRRRLDARRCRQFPAYAARTEAAFAPLGVDPSAASAVFVMDVLQNAVGMVARTGLFEHHRVAAPAMCSSLAVWGGATVDGELRHARNFDFPGATMWDTAPAVVFCEPTDGLRYGFVTTRGVDAPGITCFNEAGLTLTVHTRFHRDVRYDAPSVIDLGHEIIRTSSTLREALDTARRLGAASTWGLLVSSASEHDAVLIEVTGAGVAAVRPDAGSTHLSSTNRYVDPGLRVREVTTSATFVEDSDSRRAQVEAFAAKHAGGIDTALLEELLGDFGAPGLIDRTDDVVRLSGPSVVSAVSVASIVAEPERRSIRVSIGRAPTGCGPYIDIPWAWDGAIGRVDVESQAGPMRGRTHRGEPLSPAQRSLAERLSAATQAMLDREAPHRVRAELDDLCAAAPTEPGFATAAAIVAALDGQLDTAAAHLDRALAYEGTPGPRSRALLIRSRVADAAGRPDDARADRAELAAMTDAAAAPARAEADRDERRPFTRRRLALLSPDAMLIDLHR
ncbi:MAG TPA: C45 family autoproteolytic acyltransferase/hydrolase [Microthrixaceae bacterium]|nr:C45 family autoproteolytic acyltransferase/hydrolase [Microthrixaceae bacterium]HMT23478.1 C45 family autoproteolytic acyltransferase/hydrolase [Microthrixaceae bacterium]